jgi:hypothetical protein
MTVYKNKTFRKFLRDKYQSGKKGLPVWYANQLKVNYKLKEIKK